MEYLDLQVISGLPPGGGEESFTLKPEFQDTIEKKSTHLVSTSCATQSLFGYLEVTSLSHDADQKVKFQLQAVSS